MRNSKLLAISIPLALALSACNLPKPSGSATSDNGASFTIEKEEGSFTNVNSQDSFALANQKTLSGKFCVQDLQYKKVIANHKFVISGGSSEQELTTGSDGCGVWEESVAFNPLAQPANIEFQRTLTAKGYQKGSRLISFSINPWLDKVISLKDSKVTNLVAHEKAALKLQSVDVTRPLSLSNLTVIFSTRQLSSTGTEYELELQADPKIILKDMAGQDNPTLITQAKFKVHLTLIREQSQAQANPVRSKLAESDLINVDSLVHGQLVVNSRMKLPGGCSLSQYYLGVEISPVDGPKGLQDFHGIFQLGPCNSITGRQAPRLLNDLELKGNGSADFSINGFISQKDGIKVSDNSTTTSATEFGLQKSSLQVGQIEARPFTFVSKNNFIKERRFYLEFCLSGSVDRQEILNQPIQVTGINGLSQSTHTSSKGCVSIPDSLEFNYYSPECWKKFSVKVQSDVLGVNESIPVEIDILPPFGPFFRDIRPQFGLHHSNENQCAPGRSEIIASYYSTDKVRIDYSLDELLNLQIHKTGIFKVGLSLNRPSVGSSTGASDDKLPVGTYNLRWAVVDMSVKDLSKAAGLIYAAGDKEVTLRSNSTISEELTISMTNIKAIGDTNYILFEVSPSGQEPQNLASGMKSTTFRGPFTLANNNEGANLEITNFESVVPKLIQQYKADQAAQLARTRSLMGKERFATENNLQLINLKSGEQLSQKFPMDQGMIRQWVNYGRIDHELIPNLCNMWLSEVLPKNLKSGKKSPFEVFKLNGELKNTMLRSCVSEVEQDPRQFFDIEYRYLFERGSKVRDLGAFARDLSINQSFSLSNMSAFNEGKAVSGDVNAGARVELPSIFSASGGFRYTFMNIGWGNARTWGNSISVSSGIPATVETIGLKVRAEDYEKCAVIKLNGNQMFSKEDKVYTQNGIANFLHKYFREKSLQLLSADYSEDEKQEMAGRGFMICNGEKTKHPIEFDENYYIIHQKNPMTQGMDSTKDENRPFFVSLRGRADFISFVSFVQNGVSVPDTFKRDYQQSHLLYDPMLSVFNRGLRTYPGQIVSPR